MVKFIKSIAFGVLLTFAGLLWIGETMLASAQCAIGNPPAELAAVSHRVPKANGEEIASWLVQGRPGAGVILLLHGVRSSRWQMVERAKFLKQSGYSILLIDLPAHGESDGEHITYGLEETQGVVAALKFIRKKFPDEKIGIIGASLGAATAVFAQNLPATPTADVMVLESMFPTLADATGDRMELLFGKRARWLAVFLLWQLPLRLGISAVELQPIESLKKLKMPVLIASGSVDRHTTVAETQRIFSAANAPKEIWIVEGAAHQDLHAFAPAAYQAKVSKFLEKHFSTVK